MSFSTVEAAAIRSQAGNTIRWAHCRTIHHSRHRSNRLRRGWSPNNKRRRACLLNSRHHRDTRDSRGCEGLEIAQSSWMRKRGTHAFKMAFSCGKLYNAFELEKVQDALMRDGFG